jgi:hypothetical protein
LTLDLEHQVATVDELHDEEETDLYTHQITAMCKSNNLGLEGGQKIGQKRRAIGKGKHTTLSQRALDIIILWVSVQCCSVWVRVCVSVQHVATNPNHERKALH